MDWAETTAGRDEEHLSFGISLRFVGSVFLQTRDSDKQLTKADKARVFTLLLD